MPYGYGSFAAKAVTWLAATLIATLSLEVASVLSAAAGVAAFLALTIGGLVLFGWLGAQHHRPAKATCEECR